MPNPWDNDPIVQPASSTAAPAPVKGNPWDNDPIVQPSAKEPWAADPIVQHAGLSMPQDADVMAHAAIHAPLGQDPALMAQRAAQPVQQPADWSLGSIAKDVLKGTGLPQVAGRLAQWNAEGLTGDEYTPDTPGKPFDPNAPSNPAVAKMQQAGQAVSDIHGNTQSMIPGMIGQFGTMALGAGPAALIQGAAASSDTAHNVGWDDPGHQRTLTEAADVLGQGGINAFTQYALNKGFTSDITNSLLEKIQADVVARAGARATMGAGIGQVNTILPNALTRATVNPNQPLEQGAGPNMLAGAGMEVGGGILHDMGQGAPAPKAMPDANGATAPAVTESETSPQTQGAPDKTFIPKQEEVQNALARTRQHLADLDARAKQLESSINEPPGPRPEQGNQAPVPPLKPAEPLAEKGEGRQPVTPPTPEQLAGAKTWAEQLAEKNKGNVPYEPPQVVKGILNEEPQEESIKGHETTPHAESFFDRIKREAAEKGVGPTPDNALKASKTPEPNEDVRANAQEYAKQTGLDYNPPTDYAPVDAAKGKQIADAYDAMKHDPTDPDVKASYDAFKQETADQYAHLQDKGVTFTPSETNPYANSQEMQQDVRDNNHLSYYTGGEAPADHPMSEKVPGMGDTTYNHLFRAVHDYYGHAKEGNGFGARGEENAWRQHSALYSDAARPAMTSETRGQNSWVNFGPKGEANRADPANTTYAEQKAGLLPSEFHSETKEPGAIKKFMSDESGSFYPGVTSKAIKESAKATVEQDVVPKAQAVAKSVVGAAKWLNRNLDLGFRNEKSAETDQSLREAVGNHNRYATQMAEAVKPYAEDSKAMTPKAAAQWMDTVEAGQPSPDPKLQGLADFNKARTAAQTKDAQQYGLNTKGWNPDWVGRYWNPPESERGTGGKNSIAGAEHFLKRRGDLSATELADAGYTPKYPLHEMIARKQIELDRSISARKMLYGSEDLGITHWVPDGKGMGGADETRRTKLTDPIAAQDRQMIGPKWMAGRVANMEHFDAQNYLNEQQTRGNVTYLRPGDAMPADQARLGRVQRGTMHSDADSAHMINSQLRSEAGGDLGKMAQKAASAMAGFRFLGSVFHAGVGGVLNMGKMLGGADWRGVLRSNPVSAYFEGRKVLDQYRDPSAHPELEKSVNAIADAHALHLPAFEKGLFESGNKAWADGNHVGAIARYAYSALSSPHHFMFEHYIPKLKAAALEYEASKMLAKGTPEADVQAKMIQHSRSIDNMLGQQVRSNSYVNQGLTRVLDATFPTWRFAGGMMRETGGAIRDAAKAAGGLDIRKLGTPAVRSIVGMAVAQYGMSNLIQMVSGQGPTKNWKDFLAPQIDDKGNRVQIPGLTHILAALATNPSKFLYNRLNPAAEVGVDAVTNKNWKGQPIWKKTDSIPEGLKHEVEQAAVDVTPSALTENEGKTWPEWAANTIGFRPTTEAASQATQGFRPFPRRRK